MNQRCALFCPAYAGLSDAEFDRAETMAQQLAAACHWQLNWLPSSRSGLAPGHWLPAAQRLDELRHILDQVDILWALRGGYGCLHLVPELSQLTVRRAPLLIGFSDLTVLHGLWARRGWGPSIHGPMPAIGGGEQAIGSLRQLLNGDSLHWDQQSHPEVEVAFPGSAKGPLFPACLRVLAGMVGTAAMPHLAGHILAIEDIDERPYAIDRALSQLYQAGCLEGLRGLVTGRFPGADGGHGSDARGPSLHAVLGEWAQRLALPCIYALPFGHEADPLSLPCGGLAELSCDGRDWSLRVRLHSRDPT
ncbi:MAG: LD-carboxypeptidase [Planctomycetota bacterium]|nr:MAG: LD-carboxypeptidase [Planctomycetota bacterium]